MRDAILDALGDDGESIIQISEYLQYLSINYTDEIVISTILNLLDEQLIKIELPRNKTSNDFRSAGSEEKMDYWFELTKAGEIEWQKIEEE